MLRVDGSFGIGHLAKCLPAKNLADIDPRVAPLERTVREAREHAKGRSALLNVPVTLPEKERRKLARLQPARA